MIAYPPEPTQQGHEFEFMRKLLRALKLSRPKAGSNVRISETSDGLVIDAQPALTGLGVDILICDTSVVPPVQKIITVLAKGQPRDVD